MLHDNGDTLVLSQAFGSEYVGTIQNQPAPTASVSVDSGAATAKAWLDVLKTALPTANQLSNVLRGNTQPQMPLIIPQQASMFSGLNTLLTPTNMVLAVVGIGAYMWLSKRKR